MTSAEATAHVSGRKVGRKTVGTTVAAVTLAAVAALSGQGPASAAPASESTSRLDPASIICSPPNSASSRMAGIQEDMARAVALQQITPDQAAFLETQLAKRIHTDA